ncbi:hypothetical protein LEP1GSC120_3329 [Leptospira santarosai str. 200702252]|uniref:Uncharacterized protein n=1 Tax=Leptospira santarosai str. ZUN179 TaxID=1049985 RepID=M6UUD1_9LEPT|nr:hypothetical protein B2G51_08480 [Leptospira santarosai]EKO77951.1 hypothetical protein LEP1GSC068_0664 [Leptospira sp. Fiocruz LV3954]EMI63370.1 hypothetical protein LEP1GSC076_1252 [Leptospira sp. Fiocruz LV4135]EMO44619.1 hypothetical protein LEP1GSC187_0205 [Leptospira santarosai str. ZUN179]EMO73373.1 hypothetical protein LEP1GSC130_2553 [Leptospira santarosai str. 200403458]EMO83490.1 hypothetical protein LEP1GSC070_0098 [Leptospira santarosai str. AIM]EMP00298.1 hypothetical protein
MIGTDSRKILRHVLKNFVSKSQNCGNYYDFKRWKSRSYVKALSFRNLPRGSRSIFRGFGTRFLEY